MTSYIPLAGVWEFLDDQQKRFAGFPPKAEDFNDTITLPSTTAQAKKGTPNPNRETGFLTEVYPYKGNAWFRTVVEIPAEHRRNVTLYMERTRVSEVWVNGVRVGTNNSLCTPHSYDLSAFSACDALEICIRADNSSYPTKGGHMTSPDTQTNWNGILGSFYLRFSDHPCRISRIKAIPDAENRRVRLVFRTNSTANFGKVSGQWENADGITALLEELELTFTRTSDGTAYADIPLGKDAPLWDEYHPVICRMKVLVSDCGEEEVIFGLTDFRADGHQFTNHGKPVFLRGKHDGMIFPIEGAAPMDVEGWMKVMKTAKSYGINHYRFHTCCPPEAAFLAADLLGIYMEPEIPFWGSVHAPDDPDYNAQEQAYLIAEGKRILEEFGNHPSFAMFSLGNELWGSPKRIGEILRYYRQDESRILFTQGCNNFQFYPNILPEDDFFVGVRLSKERLIRGSYAMCDAPLGHVQTARPS
ncbi:MAG: beta-glucuronidase, partial [Oscillospiraceae bacterium]|nr:beta-glucuronidase [Oscillospiraceae bacterium]